MKYTDFGVTCAEELEQDEWSLTRPTFETPKGGVLTVVGWKGRDRSNKRYIIKCSVCSMDKELFGDGVFKTTKGVFNTQIPCGCSRIPRWTEDQQKVRINRQAKKQGYTFVGWGGGFRGNPTKCKLACPEHGEWESTTLVSALLGAGCPICGNERVRSARLKEDSFHIKNFMTAGKFSKGTKFWRSERQDRSGRTPYWNYTCPKCSQDKYVKAGLCDGVFEGHVTALSKGGLCCRCSPVYLWNQKQREYQISQEVSQRTNPRLSFIGWVSPDGYTNNESKIILLCAEHGECQISVASLINKHQGCPRCAGKNQKKAYIHMVMDGDSFVALKFGIANNPKQRLSEQNRRNIFQCDVLGVWEFPEVGYCKNAELECKQTLKTGVLSAREMKDGWTETVSVLDLEKIIAIYEKHGGKRIK